MYQNIHKLLYAIYRFEQKSKLLMTNQNEYHQIH